MRSVYALSLLMLACDPERGAQPDAWVVGQVGDADLDASLNDASLNDARLTDAQANDANDAQAPDTSDTSDAQAPDASPTDARLTDASPTDAQAPDAGDAALSCLHGEDCGNGYVCRPDQGCAGPGACVRRPLDCADVDAPVCGCDLVLYPSPCHALRAGVTILANDACPVAPCRQASDCAEDQYCARPFGACDLLGECQPRPAACPGVYAPVCACNGETYDSACEAARAGVIAAFGGECPLPPCESDSECPLGDVCLSPDGLCGTFGECQTRPMACPELSAPVCGCDQETYLNRCHAYRLSVSVASEGSCGER